MYQHQWGMIPHPGLRSWPGCTDKYRQTVTSATRMENPCRETCLQGGEGQNDDEVYAWECGTVEEGGLGRLACLRENSLGKIIPWIRIPWWGTLQDRKMFVLGALTVGKPPWVGNHRTKILHLWDFSVEELPVGENSLRFYFCNTGRSSLEGTCADVKHPYATWTNRTKSCEINVGQAYT